MDVRTRPPRSLGPPRGRGGRILPKIQSKRPVAIPAATNPNRLQHGQTRLPKHLTGQLSQPAPSRRPLQPLHRQQGNRMFKKSKTDTTKEPAAPKPEVQRKPLYDRLVAILSKDRASDVKTVDAELKLVALHDDPAEMTLLNKDQLDELARLALEAETYQATLLAATVIEQMAEDQAKSPQPLLNDAFLRYLLAKLREQRNWQRLLDIEGDHMMLTTWEAEILLQAYAVMIDNAFASWTVRCKSRCLVYPEHQSESDWIFRSRSPHNRNRRSSDPRSRPLR